MPGAKPTRTNRGNNGGAERQHAHGAAAMADSCRDDPGSAVAPSSVSIPAQWREEVRPAQPSEKENERQCGSNSPKQWRRSGREEQWRGYSGMALTERKRKSRPTVAQGLLRSLLQFGLGRGRPEQQLCLKLLVARQGEEANTISSTARAQMHKRRLNLCPGHAFCIRITWALPAASRCPARIHLLALVPAGGLAPSRAPPPPPASGPASS
jgi:hypothetical protein